MSAAYPRIRQVLCRRGIAHTIPERSDQIPHHAHKVSTNERPPDFDPAKYCVCNMVERCFNRLKQHRELATRYASLYRALAVIACTLIWFEK